MITKPLAFGADYVMHAGTKYLNGHSDVIAGALVTAADDDHWNRVKSVRKNLGAVLGPFESWLLLRGMRTLYQGSAPPRPTRSTSRATSKATPASRRFCIPACKATRNTR